MNAKPLTIKNLRSSLESILPSHSVLTKDIETLAYANDASCYYLVPQAIVQPSTIAEIQSLFAWSKKNRIPLTFRAGGTSLSGQAVTDGVLVDISKHWHAISIEENAHRVRLQPGIVGGKANEYLKKYKRKIGPDPASLYAAMVGGIIANNASGMCCGTHHNSYHTLHSMTYILPNGTVIDTGKPNYHDHLRQSAPSVDSGIQEIRREILADAELVALIRRKYSIKNTIGYSLNAFLDYEYSADILRHLMIGSEGTLGFIAEAVLHTVPDKQFKYTGIAYFPSVQSAASIVPILRNEGAEAVELMDYSCLDAMRNEKVAPAEIKNLPDTACALLIEFQEES
jgi:D-lactate dehydrogenase